MVKTSYWMVCADCCTLFDRVYSSQWILKWVPRERQHSKLTKLDRRHAQIETDFQLLNLFIWLAANVLAPFPVRRYFIKRGLWTDYRDAGVGYTIVISLKSHLSVWEINCSLRIKKGRRKEGSRTSCWQEAKSVYWNIKGLHFSLMFKRELLTPSGNGLYKTDSCPIFISATPLHWWQMCPNNNILQIKD